LAREDCELAQRRGNVLAKWRDELYEPEVITRMGKTCDIDPHFLDVEITNNNVKRNKLRLFYGTKFQLGLF
jgi:hypothetical protein